ncbi:glutaredoxin domain-containing cysteine-rich protein CG12206 [Drosophila grimshawi]|nr:glutaredoxin domain-containing cysteine-rich protein CG12206 [Drosophila grimshawi]
MSLKSQTMLLAFGDSSNSSSLNNNNNSNNDCNLQTLHVDHAMNVDLETRYSTVATTETITTACASTTAAAAVTTKPATNLYPQLLLRIGQTVADVESVSLNGEMAPAAAADAVEIKLAAAASSTAATIISCNVADDVRNVLQAETVVGEIEKGSSCSNSNNDDGVTQLTLVDWPMSAVTETVGIFAPQHTVKIQIANDQSLNLIQSQNPRRLGKQISVVKLNDSRSGSDMILQLKQHQQQQEQHSQAVSPSVTAPYQLCYLVSSGQYSPCETLDSGTGSDFESNKLPSSNGNSNNSSNSNKNEAPKLELHLKTTRIRVNTSSEQSVMHSHSQSHSRAYSLTDDSEECDESSSSLSCDSLHSNEAQPLLKLGALLPSSLLRDIRDREVHGNERIVGATKVDGRPLQYEADQYYNFHVNEHANFRSFVTESCSSIPPEFEAIRLPSDGTDQQQEHGDELQVPEEEEDNAFAGYKAMRSTTHQASTIRSSKGTVRGVKNRVRNGVATFLQLQQPNVKNYMEKDLGKVVLYTTSMGIVRETYAKCANVKQILRTLLIKFEERDVFMSIEYQKEMRERMHNETISVPQLFVEGQHIGDADIVERLNESGELRQLLRPYKSLATAYTCRTCGGYRLLPCPSCSGSKKSVHRNHFTTEFVALKCMNCDEVGLVKCPKC